VFVQALLVHSLAGIALAAFTLAQAAATTARLPAITATGLAAATVSLAQFGLALAAVHDVAGQAPTTSHTLFQTINIADTGKLVLLAGFVGAATLAASRAGTARRALGRTRHGARIPARPRCRSLPDRQPRVERCAHRVLPLLLLWAAAMTITTARCR
jgi:hypothetical protein